MDERSGDAAIGVEEVLRVAELARLRVSAEEAEALRGELGAVLGHADRLMGVDVEGVEPMAHAGEGESRWEADVEEAGFGEGVLGGIAPRLVGPFVAVPRVLGDGGGA